MGQLDRAAIGVLYASQILTGLLLHMRYTSGEAAYQGILDLSRDLDTGFILRAMHASGGSLFMGLMLVHMAKGIYTQAASTSRAIWATGWLLYLLGIGVSFTGYSLTGGSMSYWAVTVICSLASATPLIGDDLLTLLWGGTVVSHLSAMRMLSVHMLLPVVLAALIATHILLLHAGNQEAYSPTVGADRVSGFAAYYTPRDLLLMLITTALAGTVALTSAYLVMDHTNFDAANPTVTPATIAPEWYLLPYYGLVRAVPSKTIGIMAMGLSYGLLLPLGDLGRTTSSGAAGLASAARTGLLVLSVDLYCVSLVCMEINHGETAYLLLLASCGGWATGSLIGTSREGSTTGHSRGTRPTGSAEVGIWTHNSRSTAPCNPYCSLLVLKPYAEGCVLQQRGTTPHQQATVLSEPRYPSATSNRHCTSLCSYCSPNRRSAARTRTQTYGSRAREGQHITPPVASYYYYPRQELLTCSEALNRRSVSCSTRRKGVLPKVVVLHYLPHTLLADGSWCH